MSLTHPAECPTREHITWRLPFLHAPPISLQNYFHLDESKYLFLPESKDEGSPLESRVSQEPFQPLGGGVPHEGCSQQPRLQRAFLTEWLQSEVCF